MTEATITALNVPPRSKTEAALDLARKGLREIAAGRDAPLPAQAEWRRKVAATTLSQMDILLGEDRAQ